MVEIIPTINAPDWKTVKERIERIAPFTEWVNIDVSDGKFAPTRMWNNPEDLKALEAAKHVRVEVHLMVLEPEKEVPRWIQAGARRVIVHYEALSKNGLKRLIGLDSAEKKIRKLADTCHENWVEFALAILWQTPVSAITRYLPYVDMVQVLAVDPGPSGQEFHREALSRVDALRHLQGKFKIEWDGGVTLSNIRAIKNAGADVIVVASAIFSAKEPGLALEALKRELLG